MSDRAVLHMPWGPQAFQKAVLKPDETLLIGTSELAGFRISRDKQWGESLVHLSWDGTTCLVRGMKKGEMILVNGLSVTEGRLGHSDWFRVGNSTFMLCRERHTPPRAASNPENAHRFADILESLRGAEGSLYAVLDAARDERILELLRESPDESCSLLDGVKGDAMADVAPYLVQLEPRGWLLEALVSEGWGHAWGIFLDCPRSFKEVRRHFRHFLRVKEEGAAEFLYFRFYDPRVLRIFVPTCNSAQIDELHGPIRRFWLEDDEAALMCLAH